MLRLYSADARPTGRPTSLLPCANAGCDITQLTLFGTVAVVSVTHDDRPYVVGINLASRRAVWTEPDVETALVSGPLIVLRGRNSADATTSLFAIRAVSGQRVWAFRDVTGRAPIKLPRALSPSYALVRSEADPSNTLDTVRASVIDLRTGRTIAWRWAFNEVSGAFDPVTKNFTLAGVATQLADVGDRERLETLSERGRPLFAVTPGRYTALHSPQVLAACGGNTWIEGQDGIDLVNSLAGSRAASSPRSTGIQDGNVPMPLLVDGSVAVVSYSPVGDPAPDDFPRVRHWITFARANQSSSSVQRSMHTVTRRNGAARKPPACARAA